MPFQSLPPVELEFALTAKDGRCGEICQILKSDLPLSSGSAGTDGGSDCASNHPAAANRNTLAAQPLGLLFPTVRHQLAGRPDHAPPGKTGAPGENITNGTGRSG